MGLGASSNIFNEASDSPQTTGSTPSGKDGQRINKCSIKFTLPKEKDVELVREDGKAMEVKLVK